MGGCAATDSPKEDIEPLERAQKLLNSGEIPAARHALAEHLDDNPDDSRTRYLLAKTLANLGELRGARAECTRIVDEEPDSPLVWDLLANVQEQLGEHRLALEAYYELAQRTDSHAPILAIARCQLYLGHPEAALTTLEAARSAKKKNPWAEFFTYQALKRMGRSGDAEEAARTYLNLATGDKAHADYVSRVRKWLETRGSGLDARVQQTLVDYVRAACRLRLPDAEPPEESVLEKAPERVFSFDDRPAFVTLFCKGSGLRFRGRGRGRTLAAAIKGAVEALHQNPGFTPIKVRGAGLRIDIGRDLEPIELRQDRGRLVASPVIQRGRHGIAFRADGREAFCLPGDPITDDLEPHVEDLLDYACTQAGVSPTAWQSATSSVFRFETESFVSPTPGAAPQMLTFSEPSASPEPTIRTLGNARDTASRWLTRQLQPEGGLVAGYSPARDAMDTQGDQGIRTASPDASARAALALSAVYSEGQSPVILAARDHVLRHLIPELGNKASVASRAWALRALQIAPSADEALVKLALDLTRGLKNTSSDRMLVALALFADDPAHAKERGGGPAPLVADEGPGSDPTAIEWLLALAQSGDANATRQTLDWAVRQLASVPPTNGPRHARWLASFAQAAGLAQRHKHATAPRLRAAVIDQARALLRLQLNDRHSFFCKEPSRALGAFRESTATSHLHPAMSSEAVLALIACRDLLD
jgi:tetratricopeptide (TPR) repeat protein